MSFQQDRFLGGSSGGDIEELINALAEKTFYRDGSKSMEGPIGMGNNNIIGSNVIETNELAVGITPASGKVSIFAKTDKKLYIRDDTGTETELGASSGGDVVGPGSATDNNICAFDGTSGKIIKDGSIAIGDIGDVVGGGISTNNAVARYDAHSGKVIQNSIVLISDTGVISSSADLELDPDTDLVKISGDCQVTGDLTVQGTTTTTESENVRIFSNYLHNNSGYVNGPAQSGGYTIRYLPFTLTDSGVQSGNFTAGVAGVSNPTLICTSPGVWFFLSGDLIAIDSANTEENNGIYEVLSHSPGALQTLTVKGIGTTGTVEDFTSNQFITDSVIAPATIYKCNFSILRVNTSGDFQIGKGNSTPITFSTLSTSTISVPVAIADGGSGQTTQQDAINSLTAVSGASAGEILTKTGSDAVWEAAGASIPISIVQRRRITQLNIPNTFDDVTWSTSDVVTNLTVITVLSATRIKVLEPGYYETSFQAIFDPPDDDETTLFIELRRNGVAMPGGSQNMKLYLGASDKEDWSQIYIKTCELLSADDELSVATDRSGSVIAMQQNAIMTVRGPY